MVIKTTLLLKTKLYLKIESIFADVHLGMKTYGDKNNTASENKT
jgi:hypothetical protein